MKILLVAATHTELSGVLKHFGLPERGFIRTPLFDVLVSGVGMTATAFALGRYLKQDYNLVLNLGIAGSFNPLLPLGSLVNVIEDQFAELGAEDVEGFLSIEHLGFGKSVVSSNYPHYNSRIDNLKKVAGITVNSVHGQKQSIDEVVGRLSPDVESMEGAAVFYCCSQLALHVVQIRGISNYVEPRNKENWQIDLAVKNLNDWAIGFLTNH